jgi:hypothetical protein
MKHRGQRSQDSIEFRKARQYCFRASKFDPKLQERIFIGTPEAVEAFVEMAVPNVFLADIPDTPRGLVLADNRCTGAFQ